MGVKYKAEQSPTADDCWTIIRIYDVSDYLLVSGLPRERHLTTVCGQSEESIKRILRRYENPKIVTADNSHG